MGFSSSLPPSVASLTQAALSSSHQAFAFPECPVLPRKLIQELAAYHAPLEGRRQKTRLDFNENTVGFPQLYPQESNANAGFSLESYTTYPEYERLLQQLAALYKLDAAQIMLCNGSDEALFVIPGTFIEPGVERALHAVPTFPMIIHNLKLADAKRTEITLNADLTYPHKLIEESLHERHHKLVLLASPDNPTGAVLDRAKVLQWCATFPYTLFVVDEAYTEYEGDAFSLLPQVASTPNLMVTRTFSKAWGMAGCRLGFVVAHPQLVTYMQRLRSPYSVNQLAVETALALLPNAGEVFAKAEQAKQRRNELITTLRERGYTVLAGGGNFFLLKLGLASKAFEQFLAKRGILVRDRSGHRLMEGTVRISVGSEGENALFLQALEAFEQTTALVFDLDDTLVDTSNSFDVAVAFLVRKFSDVPLGKYELKKIREEGGFNDDWLAAEELLKRRGVSIPLAKLEEEGTRVYLNMAEESEPPLFVEGLLERLAARYRLFIVTGRRRLEYQQVWGKRLDPLFEAVACSDDVPGLAAKPAPDYLLWLKQQFKLETCFYMGNSVDDMTSASAAGYTPVGITQTTPALVLYEKGAVRCYPSVNEVPEAFVL